MDKDKGGFFAVGQETFIRACSLGVNQATAYLVMARGTGGDNVTTRWSAEAVSKRLGVRWGTASAAVKSLVDAGIAPAQEGNRPSYKLAKDGDLIWLPNSIVDGVGNELAPIHKLRQMQDAMVVRLFGELYGAQNLREDGGVTTKVTRKSYSREKVGQSGAYTIWYFKQESTWVTWGEVANPHRIEVTKKQEKEGRSAGEAFFKRFSLLESAGLVEWVPYLYEGIDGEPIHALAWNGMEMEAGLYRACVDAGRALLTESQRNWLDTHFEGGWLVPALSHIAEVTMIGVARLHYRPHTRLTAAWWANYTSQCEQFTETYMAIIEKSARRFSGLG